MFYDYVITGGLGFIGKNFVRKVLNYNKTVYIIDKKTPVADICAAQEFNKNPKCKIIISEIEKIKKLPKCHAIVNFAAESHVDTSIEDPQCCISSNYYGVYNLLNCVKTQKSNPLFVQISTDEVYGDIFKGSFNEDSKLSPSNPYAATKAAAEHLVTSYSRTYGLNYLITRSCNNFGSYQNHPEKLIPKALNSAHNNILFPIHGSGEYIRNWINVKDNVNALFMLIEDFISYPERYKKSHRVFNISGSVYKSNLEILNMIEKATGRRIKRKFSKNRPGQDVRYAINNSRFLSYFPHFKEERPLSIKELKEIYLSEYSK